MIRRLVGVAVLLGVGLTGWLFVWPPSASPDEADAVVLFAGGRGERLAKAVELMEDGVAPVLVISNGLAPEWDVANEACDQGPSGPAERGDQGPSGPAERGDQRRGAYEVLCPTPDPDTTRGEARMAAALAERRGWDKVVLVTSTYHARRAGMLLRRCYDGDVDVVAAKPRGGLVRAWVKAAWEWPAMAKAVIVKRGC